MDPGIHPPATWRLMVTVWTRHNLCLPCRARKSVTAGDYLVDAAFQVILEEVYGQSTSSEAKGTLALLHGPRTDNTQDSADG